MTTAVSTLLGRPVWYELMTTDPAAAEPFYKKVIGWTSEPFEGGLHPYTAFNRSGGVGVAGLMKRPEGMNMPPFWAMYVAVPKFEEAVAHIKRRGGTELSPVIEIPKVGKLQMMKDPKVTHTQGEGRLENEMPAVAGCGVGVRAASARSRRSAHGIGRAEA